MNKSFSKYTLSILLLLTGFFTNAQIIKVTGKVTDSINNPLEYANVFAVPIDKNVNISYAITNEKGNYILKLQKNKSYKVTTSFLGYVKQEVNFKINKDTTYHFKLKEDKNQLDEVTLNYTIPVKVKEDTITYNADSFKTGEERKLKDILKKLPGIEVDRKGNVTANGKKIKKLLVEDKPFFGGNTKLGVNNIPANAIDKIQVLENYNEVAMLKGLQDSDDSVLNIKLKKDKKKFVFGDVEVGAGIKNRYLLHPKLFYYSPKTSINFIGDANNQGVKSFTFSDYQNYEGGISKILTDPKSYFNLYRSDFAKYLNNQDYKAEKNNFGAFSIRHSISNASDLSYYLIASKSNTDTQVDNTNIYITGNNLLEENREDKQHISNLFAISKLRLDYNPNTKTDYSFASFIKLSNSNKKGSIVSEKNLENTFINTKNKIESINFKQSMRLNKDVSTKHTLTFNAEYSYKKQLPNTIWFTNTEILQNLIPLQPATEYALFHNKSINSNFLKALAKDYWIVHRFHHIYTSIGVNANATDYITDDGQILDSGNENNFSANGFGNDFTYSFLDAFLGLEYKFKIHKATFKPAVFYHNYQWKTKQFQEKEHFSKGMFLPQFTLKINFRNSEKLNLRYRLQTSFPNTKMLATNYVLTQFNQVFKGNNFLENNLSHTIYANYYKYNLYRGYHFNIGVNYSEKVRSIKNTIQLDGINQFNTQIMFYKPENRISTSGLFSKRINNIRYKISSSLSKSVFYQIVNNNTSKNESINSTIKPSVQTLFKKLPNVEIAYLISNNQYLTGNKSKFSSKSLQVDLDYDFLKDFIFNSDFSYDKYTNSNNDNNSFFMLNAKLSYQKEDSPWQYEISARNLFNTKYKQNNTINEFIISDTKTYILPRVIMFKLAYKL